MKHFSYSISLFALLLLMCSCSNTIVITKAPVMGDTSVPVVTLAPSLSTTATTERAEETPEFTEAPPNLPITTSMPIDGKVPDGYEWGKQAFYLQTERLNDGAGNYIVAEDGAAIDLQIRVGYVVSAANMQCPFLTDPSELMKINVRLGDPYEFTPEGLVSEEQCIVEDFWINMKYMIHPWEVAPYAAAVPITITLHTDALPEGDGKLHIFYKNADYYSDSNTIYYGRRNGVIILTLTPSSPADNAIDRIYDMYMQSQAQ